MKSNLLIGVTLIAASVALSGCIGHRQNTGISVYEARKQREARAAEAKKQREKDKAIELSRKIQEREKHWEKLIAHDRRWGPFDHFWLIVVPYEYHGQYGRYSWVSDAEALITKHPDWSAEDIYTEIVRYHSREMHSDEQGWFENDETTETDKKEWFEEQKWKKKIIFYLHKNKITKKKSKNRHEKIWNSVKACETEINDAPPSKRPAVIRESQMNADLSEYDKSEIQGKYCSEKVLWGR